MIINKYAAGIRKKFLQTEQDVAKPADIRMKFNELKKEIRDCFESNRNEKTLDLTKEDIECLVGSGYVWRKVESFMFLNQFTRKEINKFFESECTNERLDTEGQLYIQSENPTAKEIIDSIRCSVVASSLWMELCNFIKLLKMNHEDVRN